MISYFILLYALVGWLSRGTASVPQMIGSYAYPTVASSETLLQLKTTVCEIIELPSQVCNSDVCRVSSAQCDQELVITVALA